MSDLLKQIAEKEAQIATLQDELKGLKESAAAEAKALLKELGFTVSATKKAPTKTSAQTRKSTPRWQTKAILGIIHQNKGISKADLITKLETDKPGAPLDKLDGYLEKYTNNNESSLSISAAGREFLKKK